MEKGLAGLFGGFLAYDIILRNVGLVFVGRGQWFGWRRSIEFFVNLRKEKSNVLEEFLFKVN